MGDLDDRSDDVGCAGVKGQIPCKDVLWDIGESMSRPKRYKVKNAEQYLMGMQGWGLHGQLDG